jgi:SAM-dependent methyltransferase
MTARNQPIANFDNVARPYRCMEYFTFGRALERCRTHFLPQLADRRTALVLGDGDGRFLASLLAANPTLHADAVDTSSAMLRLLTRRAQSAAPDAQTRLRTHHTSALDFTPTHTYDLIVTHFFLDCLTQSELNLLATNLARHAAPNALWLISDFRIPAGPMRGPARILVRLLYLAFRLLTGLRTTALPDHAAALASAGFTCIAQHPSLAGLLTSELWACTRAAIPEYTPSMHLPPQRPKTPYPPDPVPDPEPPTPSLPEPDPGVFHHDIPAPRPGRQTPSDQ